MNNETQTSQTTTTPKWFWIAAAILLIWNLLGLGAFAGFMATSGSDEALQQSGMTAEQIQLVKETPSWVNIAFGVATIFGVLGCIALLMRKSLAIPLLIISLLGVLAQSTYLFFLSDAVQVMGVGLSPIVIPVAIALVPFAMYCAKQDWWR